ncbi:Cytochrome_b5-like_Heme /Steroid_binding_domain_containing_protein_-_putative [Leishmania infantum]|uniref:Cytochrome_b5-like_Heme /Steroid_binding_domain_containing_protein_-_putative n=1 Tax=Leishmania infantum TaxID=5671 RepID=A0A6L0XDC2_LEIIN|nr:Cytochrome_b5-like_Heme /Steroid_binding_domain_containing_protein_-_putative [Leishmania infantum]SUZ41691.1 Cytochrome_b5-like_Heme /Steroid_binding_domain_containing_protein_-_putative [Leishmania infantum]
MHASCKLQRNIVLVSAVINADGGGLGNVLHDVVLTVYVGFVGRKTVDWLMKLKTAHAKRKRQSRRFLINGERNESGMQKGKER